MWEATDIFAHDKHVAIKFGREHDIAREYALQANLKHPHIAACYEKIEHPCHDGTALHGLVLEKLDGDLSTYLVSVIYMARCA